LVSVNLFSLLCSGNTFAPSQLGTIGKFGGPIVYLLGYILFLFLVLTLVDSGPKNVFRIRKRVAAIQEKGEKPTEDLQVSNVSKKFPGSMGNALSDVSFGVSSGDIFALLGPNGAGKTSLFNIVRGGITPDTGDVLIHGSSILRHPGSARLHLGVCPQFTAIDSQLTVREHLYIYGRLKGVDGRWLKSDIITLMEATALSLYSDRLASQLSGGNQRKLSLAVSLIGEFLPPVIEQETDHFQATLP
jgi:ATP-binding cassette subfamily A (ABC1) protein 3